MGSILLVEVEEHLTVTVCGEGHLEVGDNEEQDGFYPVQCAVWAVVMFLNKALMAMAMMAMAMMAIAMVAMAMMAMAMMTMAMMAMVVFTL